MKIAYLLILCFLLGLPLNAHAGNKPAPHTYIIQKGDTLWGISKKFLKDPYYWPNLWANNPDVGNPHFIYPGQEILIYDGRIEIVPVRPEHEEITAAPETAEVKEAGPEEEVTIKTLGGSEGFITTEELATSGTLIDAVDNRILVGEGDTVFLEMKDLSTAPGDLFTLYEPTNVVKHPVTGDRLGYMVNILGTLRIDEMNAPVATARITDSFREITRGARLRPYEPELRRITLKNAGSTQRGYLVTGQDNKTIYGPQDVVYIDLGSSAGIEEGNLLHIFRPRGASKVAKEKRLKLPDIFLGTAVVLEVRPRTATALILKSLDPIELGDRFITVTK